MVKFIVHLFEEPLLRRTVVGGCLMGDSGERRAVVLRWSRHPRCVGLARFELRKALAAWGLGALEDSAVLILSELLTNAARHAHVSPGREIETRYVPRVCGGLRIEVHDASDLRPAPRVAGADDCDGRGLVIVEALADAWGGRGARRAREGGVGAVRHGSALMYSRLSWEEFGDYSWAE
ncbi:ATP-binding protein [Streptomyces sp. NPDC093109]|uniref:ATP-binding protein n=1 Tax=Streptomyces sp. NPDC093109 TaxID=3154977 RepID=UPI00344DAD45